MEISISRKRDWDGWKFFPLEGERGFEKHLKKEG